MRVKMNLEVMKTKLDTEIDATLSIAKEFGMEYDLFEPKVKTQFYILRLINLELRYM